MARDKGQEVAVVATAQSVVIGEPGKWYTFVNDDAANDIYYRLKDENTMAGIAAVVVATPIFGARLKASELVHVEGGTWEVCCATGLTATLRVVPGRLMQSGDVDLAGMADDIANLTADVASTLYNGGGTANAMQDTIATSALPTGAAVIDCDGSNALDIEMFNATATEAFTLMVSEYSAATPTIATLIRQTPVSFAAADQDRTVDRACVSLTTGTEIYAKSPVRVAVTPGAYVQLSIVENITGANYARYQLRVLDSDDTDEAAIKDLVTAGNVDLAAIEVLLTGTAANTARSTATAVIPTQDIDAAGVLADHAKGTSANTAIGTTVDDVLAAETLEDATARTGISLWKRMVNKLIDIKALLVKGTAAMAASIGVTIATDDTQFGAVGAAADPDGNIHGQLRSIAEALVAQVPTGATALNTAATTGVGTVDVITLTANTIYVDIMFDTAAHYATPGASPPTTLYGSEYQPGITYRIQTFKTTNLYVESVGAAGAYHVTCYTKA